MLPKPESASKRACWLQGLYSELGLGGAFGDINPLNKVPFQKANSRIKKGPLQGVSLILPRICGL